LEECLLDNTDSKRRINHLIDELPDWKGFVVSMFFVVGGVADNLPEWLLVGQKHDCQSVVVAISKEKVSEDAEGA
jgi:hypothetical protein